MIINHSKPTIGKCERDSVDRVMRSGFVGVGDYNSTFSKVVAGLSQKKYGALMTSGTAALRAALRAMNIGKGDEVIIPAYVCTALIKAVNSVGASPVIVDVEMADGNISVVAAAAMINKNTKAIIAPHMFGQMVEINALKKLGVPIIEDCAMSIGSSYAGKSAGSFGDISVFSFYATKMITTGTGGAIVTSSKKYAESFDKNKMSDVQAAIGLAQIEQLKSFIRARKLIAKTFTKKLAGTHYELPKTYKHKDHIFYRYAIRTPFAKQLRSYLKKHGIVAGFGVTNELYQIAPNKSQLKTTKELLDTTVSIPIYPTLTKTQQSYILKHLKAFDSKYGLRATK